MLRQQRPWIAGLLVILTAVVLAGCDSGWVGPLKEPGPLPLSSTNALITRMVKTRATFEVTLREVYWDEGNGPVPVAQRLKPVADAVPKELLDQVDWRSKSPSTNGSREINRTNYDAWAVMVAVHPDVMIITVREQSGGPDAYPFENWSIAPDVTRGDYIHQRLEFFNYIVPDFPIPINAGTLVPWSDTMYVVSTDQSVKYGRLEFKDNLATVMLPDGKLVFKHHDDDVDVSRE
jgi:hypothetical protein